MLSETLSGRGASYVLIDRGTGFRNKCDRKIRNRPENGLRRYTIDIADLVLDEIPAVKQKRHCVLLSKHLCGVATCLGLRSAVAMKNAQDARKVAAKLKVDGDVISPHFENVPGDLLSPRLLMDDHVNKEFFRKPAGSRPVTLP